MAWSRGFQTSFIHPYKMQKEPRLPCHIYYFWHLIFSQRSEASCFPEESSLPSSIGWSRVVGSAGSSVHDRLAVAFRHAVPVRLLAHELGAHAASHPWAANWHYVTTRTLAGAHGWSKHLQVKWRRDALWPWRSEVVDFKEVKKVQKQVIDKMLTKRASTLRLDLNFKSKPDINCK